MLETLRIWGPVSERLVFGDFRGVLSTQSLTASAAPLHATAADGVHTPEADFAALVRVFEL